MNRDPDSQVELSAGRKKRDSHSKRERERDGGGG